MLQETTRYDDLAPDECGVDTDADYLRSIIAASTKLPVTVVAAEFSKIFDRVLEPQAIAALTDSSNWPQPDAVERCRLRDKALVPYSGKRLICVVIALPGIFYTVEIDPCLSKVIHWEYQAS